MEALDHDVVVLGAGISGIDAAWHLKHKCPTHSFVVLEAKQEIGGTWSLFKYPGIRSDSDMQTFGFHFKPWRSPKPIAPGEDIMNYLRETVDEFDLEQHIRYGTTVASARWSSAEQRWTLTTSDRDGGEVLTCAFLFGCTGYYSHDEPYRPEFPGEEDFGGRIVHPQQWGSEDDAAYPGKRVAIIGSGATAVTMLPNIAAGGAAHVTMVQRTPTYIVAQAETDATAARLGSLLPAGVTHSVLRTRNVLRGTAYFEMSKKYPEVMKKSVLKLGRELLQGCEYGEPETFAKHFEPPYNPWDQRMCLTPDGDFFTCIREGNASVVTDHIEKFTETGIQMVGGEHVDADIIVTATGLNMQSNFPMSTMEVTVDGEPYDAKTQMIYKGVMLSGVPNFAFTFGYTNASWTLKADLTGGFVTRLLNTMRQKKYSVVQPILDPSVGIDDDFMDLSSGYVQRAKASMPKQGTESPWKLKHNYIYDSVHLGLLTIEDGVLNFTAEGEAVGPGGAAIAVEAARL